MPLPSDVDPRSVHFVPIVARPLEQLRGVAPSADDGSSPNAETLRKIFLENPYDGFELERHPGDIQGWNSFHTVFADLIGVLRPRRIIEVGVWKGVASIHMARVARELGTPCEVICIDTWLGSPEHILDHGNLYDSLRVRHGFPQLFYTFMSNVLRAGAEHQIVPLPMTSESAIVVLQQFGLKADLVHIDAAHEYGAVLRDLRQYWSLLSDRGVLIGDDYAVKPGVTRAAHDFAAEVGRELCGFRPKFVIAKSREITFSLESR